MHALSYKDITIRHLLVHTSGLPDYIALFDNKWDKEKLAYKEDILRLLAEYHPPVEFAPGEKWEYSNTGYSLLATGEKDQPIKNRVYGYSSNFKF